MSRNLFLGAIGLTIVALALFVLAGGTVDQATGQLTGGNAGLRDGGLGLYAIGGLLGVVAWIGSLIKTAQLSRWGWFVGILITGIGLLIYVFAGPTTKRA